MVTFTNTLTAGETFTCDVTEVSSGTVAMQLRGPAGYDITPTLLDGTWSAQADTEQWTAGRYELTVWLTLDGKKSIIHRGRVNVAAAVGPGDVFDPRSNAEKIIEAIEGHLAGNGQDPTWRRYKINNREMERYSVAELLQLLKHYQSIVAQEQRKAAGRSVLGPRIAVRF